MGKTGNEPIKFNGEETGFCLRDFWSWGFSNLLDNTLRGSYSEFIVAVALGVDIFDERVNWEPWDLTAHTERGDIRVEVKSGSYLQAWEQDHASAIRFSIRPAMQWSASEGYSGEQRRQSDVYVFCVYAETDEGKADPMNLDGWEFYVIPTERLDAECGSQKTITLNSLLRLDPVRTDFAGLKTAVEQSV